MTIEEIFTKIASHMKEGISYHDEMCKAYEFLGLKGFSKCQEYHYFEEIQGYRQFLHYYSSHYFKLLQIEYTRAKIIPDFWYKYATQAIDVNIKKNSIKELTNKWIEWERSTKKLYQEMREELTKLGELAAALELDNYIRDVSEELSYAEKALINLETIGYDMVEIIDWQKSLYHKYKKKLGW